jgi:hypothetical protein
MHCTAEKKLWISGMRITKKHNEDPCRMNYLPLPEVNGEQEKESGGENKRRKVEVPQIFAGSRE